MKCADLMKTDVECCKKDELVGSIAERMRTRNLGFVPVCDGSGTVIGTITDRDLAMRVIAEHRDIESTQACDIMTADVVCCRPNDDLLLAEQLMSKHKKSRIVCVDENRKPVGVISLSDIARQERDGRASALLRSVAQREARL